MKKYKIALVDDHSLFLKGLGVIVSSFEECEVMMTASNGKEFIDKLAKLSKSKQPDIVILDINMPVMNGFDTAKYIRSNYSEIKILGLSMYEEEDVIIKMLSCGANGYLVKNCAPEILENAIKSIIKTGVYATDELSQLMLARIQSKKLFENDVVFTEKELRFLELCCTELSYKEISEELGVSHRTVDGYRENLFQKLNLHSRTGLVLYAIKTGIVTVYK